MASFYFTEGAPYLRVWHFESFFPGYKGGILRTLNSTCAKEYLEYRNQNATCPPYQPWIPGQCATGYLVDCVLNSQHEWAKADMAAAGVVLGLLPFVLPLLGYSDAEPGLLALKRPVLALALSIGQPAIKPMRILENRTVFHELKSRSALRQAFPSIFAHVWMIVLVEWLLVGAAVINVCLLATDLTVKAMRGNDILADYHLIVWMCWAFGLHMAAIIAIWAQIKRSALDNTLQRPGTSSRLTQILAWLRQEFRPGSIPGQAKITLKEDPTWPLIVLRWFVACMAVMHAIYGTLALSGTIFVSAANAMDVFMRYAASVALCRIVVLFELAGLHLELESEDTTDKGKLDDLRILSRHATLAVPDDKRRSSSAILMTDSSTFDLPRNQVTQQAPPSDIITLSSQVTDVDTAHSSYNEPISACGTNLNA